MGITGELVRSVFSKSRSFQSHGRHQGGSSGVEKKRWRSSVRSYLCGDEHNSVRAAEDSGSVRSSTVAEVDLASFRSNVATNITSACAEEDTASVKSSEATVNQPLHGDIPKNHENLKEKQNSAYKLFQQEDAALIIQSAFRSFRERRARDGAKMQDDKLGAKASPSGESVGTSVEVQTGNSSDIFSINKEESFDVRHTIRHKARAQVLKLQEDWDDSTVSSVISKMRIQHRLEAATRRERALAYAFSQQLRMCSKKKQNSASGDETNMGWSWLERWMAARQPEIAFTEDNINGDQKTVAKKRVFDAAWEEKESCGSNEVPSIVEVVTVPKNVPRAAKNRSIKGTRSFSRQNSASSDLCPKEAKDIKKVCQVEDEKEKSKRPKQPGNK
ncbi:hypothetical protein CDL12_00819 [Handroanthus impetiginosus]|uniref:Protein IQ-DOMAIN 1 n=1 Tax=Handroanthus impetiginosus TaxID=429701 RepID=A0A2G9I9L2_9LAMI|nr:hypothetical protein CDL12_00819 [Handroanthus impetiginosus]